MTQTANVDEKIQKFASANGLSFEQAQTLFEQAQEAQQTAALQAHAGNKRTGGKPQKEEFAIIPMAPGRKVSLAELISLADIPVEDAKEAVRPIDKDTVESYQVIYQNTPDVMPAIDVVNTSWGVLWLDGGHRTAAQKNNVKARFLDLDGNWKNEQAKENYEKALRKAYVKYNVVECTTVSDAIMYAFRANLANGLQMSKTVRCKFALWLMRQAEAINEKLSMRDAAIAAGTVHSNVSQYVKRLRIKAAQEIIAAEENGRDIKMPAEITLLSSADVKKIDDEVNAIRTTPKDVLPDLLSNFMKSATKLVEALDNTEALGQQFQAFMIGDGSDDNIAMFETLSESLTFGLETLDGDDREESEPQPELQPELSQVND